MTRRIVGVSAGLSEPSSTRLLTDSLTEAVRRHVTAHGEDVSVEVVELRPLARLIADQMITRFPSGELTDAIEKVIGADALIAVTPVFSGSYSGLFKSFFDNLDVNALDGKPVLVGATGGSARHSLMLDHAMRPLFSYLHASVVPTGVMAATEDFGTPGLDRRIDRAAAELVAALLGVTAGAASAHSGFLPANDEQREAGFTDRFDEVTDFTELLRRVTD
ncbi:putative NAD(P)H-dependent FMN reductase [Janibacter sp. HTCC2649]|uniref:FMN reductase n=1 Tax=Janibacter sp. HTCC2649 TaxID=313589 RepID=UPI000066ED2B|nr:FMN reductase [Janibacter sp. HTCC2649]EAP99462.1 putative NAD(P)H-dependent FMN reductase [Janibacter sp. HTCC2649]